MRAIHTVWANAELTSLSCSECGVEFALTNDFMGRRRDDHKTFYCPNGHSQWYPGETKQEKEIRELKRQVEQAQREAASQRSSREWAESQAHGARVAAGKAKAAKRRLEHRIACGVCPHCKRTFKQLAAHMKSKHPEVRR